MLSHLPRLLLTLAAILGCAAASHAEPVSALTPADSAIIRDVADGAGPSQVITMGKYVLVVDPWNLQIRRYLADDIHSRPAICLFPRTFAPGRVVRTKAGVRLIAEPYGPDGKGGYNLRERSAMTITPAQVRDMPIVGPCRFDIGAVRRTDTPPRIRASDDRSDSASYPLPSGTRAWIAPQGKAGSQVYAVRYAGSLSHGRSLLWWSEVGGEPPAASANGLPPEAGRLMVRQYVGVFDAAGGPPQSVVQIITAHVPPLLPDHVIPKPTKLEKPGLEFISGGTGPHGDAIWIAAANMPDEGRGQFELRRYDLAKFASSSGAEIELVPSANRPEPLADRNDPAPGHDANEDANLAARDNRPASFGQVRKTLQQQIAFRWQFPEDGQAHPCDGRDKCTVAANEDGALGTGPQFTYPVGDDAHPHGGALWVQPRDLVGVRPGTWIQSVPYSIGGVDLADTFAKRLAANYGSDRKTATPDPIGHIGEGMEWHGEDTHYPLGIDCSALIAMVYDVKIRSTGRMVRANVLRGKDGHAYAVPLGPDQGCPEPVQNFADLKPGDILLRNGHVVIFNGFTTVADAPGRSRAMRVFESTSRCGAVCESVYDPTYFAGWWMLRMDHGATDNCPLWLEDRTPKRAGT
ncbi:hypothetical protein GRI58_01990 [Porphyrobacter algicida]|uniref:NlpC/P60 domain-containing protein n=1 Tax=Qipengyuania algicida TaxID=1836209 RepID=A0A845AAZ7_9SPHN|nr:hypothetical protein [Qipengyuania algicida]MXP27592.1 hypothetical protein [Qipengyuania algicida]